MRGMYGKSLTALCVLIVISIGAAIFTVRSQPENKTYRNSVHHFSLEYAPPYEARELGDEEILIRGDAGAIHVRVLMVQGEPGASLSDSVSIALRGLCAGESDARTSCGDTSTIEPYATRFGDEGFVIRLLDTTSQAGNASHAYTGPYYVVPLSSSATASKVVAVYADDPTSLSDALLTVAASVRTLPY